MKEKVCLCGVHVPRVRFLYGCQEIFALFLKSKKDGKYRLHWNIYHYTILPPTEGVIVFGSFNIFIGFDILSLDEKWK
ncbi:auxin induced-like protein, putative [Medicago truncatula]|uniref:Auxin induced-like protein, putative n=1 Tax=Medicago truncatula TaxID=3880 RepID=G7KY00_MEDTR|nr:auxin induced-like protein, putative [Medicago truncatula]